jgi:hypothetical protein
MSGLEDDSWPWPAFPRRARRNYQERYSKRLTGWEGDFLSALRDTGNVHLAEEAAGVSRSLAYKRRGQDAAFAEAWDEALEEAIDKLEAVAWRRASEGVKKTKGVWFNGRRVGEEAVLEFSDTLLIFLLKAHRPQKYRENVQVSHSIAFIEAEARQIAEQEGLDPEEVIAEARRIMKRYP